MSGRDTKKRPADIVSLILVIIVVVCLSGTIYLIYSTYRYAPSTVTLSVRVNTDEETAKTTDVTAVITSEDGDQYQKTFACNTDEPIAALESGAYEMLVTTKTNAVGFSLSIRESGISISSGSEKDLFFEYDYNKEEIF